MALAGVVAALDLGRPPERQLAARTVCLAIRAHRATTAPWLRSAGVECRFVPSCSRYAEQVVREQGALCGGWLTVRRLARCGPWTPASTLDPPPRPAAAGHRGDLGRPVGSHP